MALCYYIVKSKEFKLIYSELSESCTIAEVTNNLEPIVYKYNMLSGRSVITTDGARLDIAASSFWGGRYQRTFLDVRVFNPYAPFNRQTTIDKCFQKHEAEKKRAYEQHIWKIEHASFTPLVLSTSWGFTKEETNFYKRLASKLAEKWDHSYSLTMNCLGCTLSFALLCSAVQCIRGARSARGHAVKAGFSPVIWCQLKPKFDLVKSASCCSSHCSVQHCITFVTYSLCFCII